jgi:hypothetical protein
MAKQNNKSSIPARQEPSQPPANVSKQTASNVFENPFKKDDRSHINAGTVAIEESRAVAEVIAKLQVAKSFPRDEATAFDRIIKACKRAALAKAAEYSYPRGKETVSGASIRFAEVIAAAWGNIEYGIRELSNKDGESEMEAYCWDLETNVLSSQKFTVKHERSTKFGAKILTDQRDIYENNANLAARRMRGRILAIIDGDIIEKGLAMCRATLRGDVSNIPARIEKMIPEFAKFGVTADHITKRLDKKLDKITADDLSDLIAIYNSIKDDFSKPSDWYDIAAADDSTPDLKALNDQIKQGQDPEPKDENLV